MLGLRFFECRRCRTVYAGPDAPPECDDCSGGEFADLTGQLQAAPYFSRAPVRDEDR